MAKTDTLRKVYHVKLARQLKELTGSSNLRIVVGEDTPLVENLKKTLLRIRREEELAHDMKPENIQARLDQYKAHRDRAREETIAILKPVLLDNGPAPVERQMSMFENLKLLVAAWLIPSEFLLVRKPLPRHDSRVVDGQALVNTLSSLWMSRDHQSHIEPEVLQVEDVDEVGDDEVHTFPPRAPKGVKVKFVPTHHISQSEGEE